MERKEKKNDCENEQLKRNELLNAMHEISMQVTLRSSVWCASV